MSAKELGWNVNKNEKSIIWQNSGLDEIGIRPDTGDIVIRVDKRYFRPTEVNELLGDARKAKDKLGWVPKSSLDDLVKEMISCDLEKTEKEIYIKKKFKS